MTSSTIPARSRTIIVICVAFIALEAWRFIAIVPHWLQGLPPAYPGQYETRLLSAASGMGLVGALLVSRVFDRASRRAQSAYWGLLVLAGAAFAVQLATNH